MRGPTRPPEDVEEEIRDRPGPPKMQRKTSPSQSVSMWQSIVREEGTNFDILDNVPSEVGNNVEQATGEDKGANPRDREERAKQPHEDEEGPRDHDERAKQAHEDVNGEGRGTLLKQVRSSPISAASEMRFISTIEMTM